MLNIAIVEDDKLFANKLASFLERFGMESREALQYRIFENPLNFLTAYQSQYDIIFMDIEMPEMNGMEVAQRLREIDGSVILIFVTYLAQYAVKGYEVEALDYILKPLNYPALSMKLRRAVARCHRESEMDVTLNTNNGVLRVRASSVKYVDIYDHHILYHTENGNYSAYGTLKQIEESLPKTDFFRCSNSCIVNLRYVTKVDGLTVTLDGKALSISRLRRKDFLTELHRYCGELALN